MYTDVYYKYIYIIYAPNLGLRIAASVQEREQGRFRENTEGAGESRGGSRGSTEGAEEDHEGALREQRGILEGSAVAQQMGAWNGFSLSRLELLPSMLLCCLDFTALYRILLKNNLKIVPKVGPNRATSSIFNRT